MTVGEARRKMQQRLRAIDAEHEAVIFMEQLLQVDLKELLLHAQQPLSGEQIETLERWLTERERGVPIQYILGEWTFAGLLFAVQSPVLIPREDSESLLCAAEEERPFFEGMQVLDLCCGTGCLGLSWSHGRSVELTSVDVDAAACQLTEKNARRLGVPCTVYQEDILAAQFWRKEAWQQRFDLIFCNPPYIPSADIDTLDALVRENESARALDGGADGLVFYRLLAENAAKFLSKEGVLVLEIGWDQAADVQAIFSTCSWAQGRLFLDDNGRDRALAFRKRKY